MGRPSRYSPEVRERAVRMVSEHEGEYASQWAAIGSIATKIGYTPETLRKWVRQAERDSGKRAGLTVTSVQEFQRGVPPDLEYPDPETPNAHFAFGNGVMKYLVFQDPDWDYSTYDFSTFQSDRGWVSSTLDATDPDLDAFRERGGKLLVYNGWRDMALTPLGTIEYYEEVVERDASATADVRLIMLPGMDHCSGGPGPSFVNWLDQINNWLETDQAPEQVTAYWVDEQMQLDGSRLACAYPNVLTYDGVGKPRDASSFSCVGGK